MTRVSNDGVRHLRNGKKYDAAKTPHRNKNSLAAQRNLNQAASANPSSRISRCVKVAGASTVMAVATVFALYGPQITQAVSDYFKEEPSSYSIFG